LDESGDLGIDFVREHPSREFVVTLLVRESGAVTAECRVALTRTLKNKLNSGRKRDRIVSELKGTGTTLTIKRYFYRHAPKNYGKLYTVVVNKEWRCQLDHSALPSCDADAHVRRSEG